MKHFSALAFGLLALFSMRQGYSQNNVSSSSIRSWNASWIAAPNDPGTEYGVYYFRKDITLARRPDSFIVYVSADNRYKLYVNDNLVSLGPARGNTYYWNYETVNLSPYLLRGRNAITALVWNEAQYRSEAQITIRTAFILQGSSKLEEILNMNDTWECVRDTAYQPLPGYFAASVGELVDMNKIVIDPEAVGTDNSKWPAAATLFKGQLKGMSDGFGWELVPSSLPPMEMTNQRIPILRKAWGMDVRTSFPKTKVPLTIPANSRVILLLDQSFETNAYVTLNFSGGKDAGISLSYAESLFDNIKKYGMRKGDRNDVKGKDFSGREDSLISEGREGQSFTTLYFCTYSGGIPHPDGRISVQYTLNRSKWEIIIVLPQHTSGILVWKSRTYNKAGNNSFII